MPCASTEKGASLCCFFFIQKFNLSSLTLLRHVVGVQDITPVTVIAKACASFLLDLGVMVYQFCNTLKTPEKYRYLRCEVDQDIVFITPI